MRRRRRRRRRRSDGGGGVGDEAGAVRTRLTRPSSRDQHPAD
jgi:hypothetical protein